VKDRARTGDAARLRLLVAEDDPVSQKLAVGILAKRGHSVRVAQNGREAVEAVEQEPFDLVLMDLHMPEMDGFEATALIRAREFSHGGHLPIVAVTARAVTGDRERCFAAKMDDFVAKPVKGKDLVETIERLVAKGAVRAETPGSSSAGQAFQQRVLHERFDGDLDLLRAVAGSFLENTPALVGDLRVAVAVGDPAAVSGFAHRLRGSLANFGADDAVEAALRLERMGAERDLGGAAEACGILIRGYEDLRACLERLLAPRSETKVA
jgi:CheY-like chemotaxis protein/HPt (histidine-containing phosphotransfer) domain-containing protein